MFEPPVRPSIQFKSSGKAATLRSRFIYEERQEILQFNHDREQSSSLPSGVKRKRDWNKSYNFISPQDSETKVKKRRRGHRLHKGEGGSSRRSRGQDKERVKSPGEDDTETPQVLEDSNEFRGLFSEAQYLRSGDLKGHVLYNQRYDIDPRTGDAQVVTIIDSDVEVELKGEQGIEDQKSNPKSRRSLWNHLPSYDLYMNGLEPLPRPASPLKVVKDSPLTLQLYGSKLSDEARRLVTKNSTPEGITVIRPEVRSDIWRFRSLKIRHTHVVSSLMYLAILNRDYQSAWRAFCLLIRMPHIDIRVIWTIGLELLRYRAKNHIETSPASSHSSQTRNEDEDFIEWLVVNYPYNPRIKRSKWKILPRAPDFFPHLIISMLKSLQPKKALDRLQEIMLESPYSDDPLLHSLSGIATIQLIENHQNDRLSLLYLISKAKSYFDNAERLGGDLPRDILNFQLEELQINGNDGSDGDDYGRGDAKSNGVGDPGASASDTNGDAGASASDTNTGDADANSDASAGDADANSDASAGDADGYTDYNDDDGEANNDGTY